MVRPKILFTIISICLICANSRSQTNAIAEIYVGSTPCDALIKSVLKIPDETKCEFIKWDLSVYKNKRDSTFQLEAFYGVSQPNTNGFIGGGEKISVAGKYTCHNKVCRLSGEKLQSPVFLIVMDDNILHFADGAKNFIVGNGG